MRSDQRRGASWRDVGVASPCHPDAALFRFAATIKDSSILIVDADLTDIEYAKAKVLLDRFPTLARLQTSMSGYGGSQDGYLRPTSNPMADDYIVDTLTKFANKRLIILGDDSNGGVSSSAFSALELGYDVYVVDDATTYRGKASRKLFNRRLVTFGGIVLSARQLVLELEQSIGTSC